MPYTFCTLFDKNYLYRGLALYNSLERHCPDFSIYILCLDDACYDLLAKFDLPKARLIKLKEIEDEELLRAKASRGVGEYCWTLASVFTFYVLKNFPNIGRIAYLDSDIYFYSSPGRIYEEMGDDSILIIKHNYSPQLEYLTKRSGIYNVAMVVFKNDERGLECLTWWKVACIKWCYNRLEDGKFGDQMYLDDWPGKFKGVHVLSHLGGDVAPWNADGYTINVKNDKIMITNDQELIFYHFHTLRIISQDQFVPYSSFYRLSREANDLIYKPYISELQAVIKKVKVIDVNYNFGFGNAETLRDRLKQLMKRYYVSINYIIRKYEKTKAKG